MPLITDKEVDVQVLHDVGGPDEHLVAHDQDRMSRIFHVFGNLGTLEKKKHEMLSFWNCSLLIGDLNVPAKFKQQFMLTFCSESAQ